jgi:TPR repeat protein
MITGNLYLLGHPHGEYVAKRNGSPPRRIEPDHKLAVAWYRRGIAKGTPGSNWIAFELGRHYLTGEHLEQDLQLAEKWLVHSATKKHPQAQQLLGEEYASGARLRQDTDAAIYWLALAGGNSREARLKLAEIYLEGRLISRSFGQALKWLMLDPDNRGQKNREMKLVAQKGFDGRFSAAEESAAQMWLVEMAISTKERATTKESGYGYLEYVSLAELYELGLGLEQDMQKAIYWYRQAAEHGIYSAKTRLEKLGVDWKMR